MSIQVEQVDCRRHSATNVFPVWIVDRPHISTVAENVTENPASVVRHFKPELRNIQQTPWKKINIWHARLLHTLHDCISGKIQPTFLCWNLLQRLQELIMHHVTQAKFFHFGNVSQKPHHVANELFLVGIFLKRKTICLSHLSIPEWEKTISGQYERECLFTFRHK